MILERTTVTFFPRPVIVTQGGIDGASGKQLYGVFATEDDARSSDADGLAIAIVSRAVLTPEQQEMAERNSEALSADAATP